MAEGDGSGVGMAEVDASDVFNPKQTCITCGFQNDIATTTCKSCGRDLYAILNAKNQIEIEDTTNDINGNQHKHSKKKSLTNMFFDKKIAKPDPSSQEMVITPHQSEGVQEVANIEEFSQHEKDIVNEGRKNRNNNNNNLQNINGGIASSAGNRPLFTTILVI
eukprot:319570_1